MKKYCYLLFLIISSVIYANDIYIEPVISYSNSLYSDFLYTEYGKLNSRLDYASSYQFKTGAFFGFDSDFFKINVSGIFFLPQKCGTFYDSDWKIQNLKTSFSIHDLYNNWGLNFRFDSELKVPIREHFKLNSCFSFFYNFSSLSAKEGIAYKGTTYWTGLDHDVSWDSEYAVQKRVYGIDYRNHILSILLGTDFSFDIKNNSFGLKAFVSPFSFFFAIDHHLGKEGGSYYQMIQKGFFSLYEFNAYYSYKISDKIALDFACDFLFTRNIPGDFYFGYYAVDHIIADETSSFMLSQFEIQTGVKFFVK